MDDYSKGAEKCRLTVCTGRRYFTFTEELFLLYQLSIPTFSFIEQSSISPTLTTYSPIELKIHDPS
jgi:hypothetical protein